MNQSAQTSEPPEPPATAGRKKSPADRWIKLGFLAAFLVLIALVTFWQLRGPKLGWGSDLPAALAQAARENRRVVVFVRSFPVSETGKQMVEGTLSKPDNQRALAEGKYILVEIRFSRDAPWAKEYGVTGTPTMLVISPDGQRFYRQAGFIGETAFRDEFLAHPLTERRVSSTAAGGT